MKRLIIILSMILVLINSAFVLATPPTIDHMMIEGETVTYTLDGKYYEVTASHIGSGGVNFIVNGESTGFLEEDESYTLGDGAVIKVKNFISTQDPIVEFSLKTEELTHLFVVDDFADAEYTLAIINLMTELISDGKIAEGEYESVLNSEVTRSDLDKRVTTMIYSNEARIIIGENSPAEYVILAANIASVLEDMGIDVETGDTILSSEVDSDDLTDLFPKFLPEMCSLPVGLACLDFMGKSNEIQVLIQNAKGFDMEDVEVSLDGAGVNSLVCSGKSTLYNGEKETFTCNAYFPEGKLDFDIHFSYKNAQTGLKHYSIGQLRVVMPESISRCYDSDDGKDYYKKGSVDAPAFNGKSNFAGTYTDYCDPSENGALNEYYCIGDSDSHYEYIKCENGCEDGACIGGLKVEMNISLNVSVEIDGIETTSSCGDQECFEEAFKNCEYGATLTSKLLDTITYKYEIVGETTSGTCNIMSKYLDNPNPAWENVEMTCTYDRTKDFNTAVQDMSRCAGALYNLMMGLPACSSYNELRFMDTTIYTVDGKDYEIRLDYVYPSRAKFLVNGEMTGSIDDYGSYELMDGKKLIIHEIFESDEKVNSNRYGVRFCIDGKAGEIKKEIRETAGECTDTDGGKDYYKKGTTLNQGWKRTDSCTDMTRGSVYECSGSYCNLAEYTCGDGNTPVVEEYYRCPNGCKNGVCIRAEEEVEEPVPVTSKKPIILHRTVKDCATKQVLKRDSISLNTDLTTSYWKGFKIDPVYEIQEIDLRVIRGGNYWNYRCKDRYQEQCINDGSFDTYYDEWCEYEAREEVVEEEETEKGTVTIINYGDYQCSFCKRFHQDVLVKVEEEYGNKINLEFKHFPLAFHSNAHVAAEAAECARDQGRFVSMHNKLFEEGTSSNVEFYVSLAEDIGLDTERFRYCAGNRETKERVEKDFKDGQALGITGTPTTIINGEMIVGAQSFESVKKIIDKALSQPQPAEEVAEEEEIETVEEEEEIAETRPEVISGNGCSYESTVVPFGTRLVNSQNDPVFCDINKQFKDQRPEDTACQNNYECLSNSCIENQCVSLIKELKETRGLIEKIKAWFSRIFGDD